MSDLDDRWVWKKDHTIQQHLEFLFPHPEVPTLATHWEVTWRLLVQTRVQTVRRGGDHGPSCPISAGYVAPHDRFIVDVRGGLESAQRPLRIFGRDGELFHAAPYPYKEWHGHGRKTDGQLYGTLARGRTHSVSGVLTEPPCFPR